jgi:signal transduction histidine kinase
MLRSIRNQILVPLVAVQGVAVATLAVTAATLAARRSEQQIVGRLNEVIDTLGHSNFPYTQSVLTKMRGLSGAHFAVYDENGRLTDATLPSLDGLAFWARSARPSTRLEALANSPTLLLNGTRYFTVPLRSAGGARTSTLLVLYPETSWRQARWEAVASPLAVGLGTLALMAALTSWIAHRISGRIRRLREQVALIAGGDFEAFDPGPTNDEVRDLARAINGMSAQLNEMQQTIRRSERTRLLAQLAAGLAHQLRNALTGARMSIQLHAKRFPPQGGDETLNVALRQLAITEEQVKGLLSLGRVERQPHAPCDLGKLLEDVARLVQPSCQHARVEVRLRRDVKPFQVHADEAGLRAAILNLTMNAIEAAGPGGTVDLGESNDHGEVVIEVRDDGPGPPEAVAESLLEAFVTTKPEGVGLGLAIAQQVATEHGGRLSWSRNGGETRFRLTLAHANGTPKEDA